MHTLKIVTVSVVVFGGLPLASSRSFAQGAGAIRSHPPMHILPKVNQRPMSKGPGFFVDPAKGVNSNDGSKARPWKTLKHAVGRLKPGDTLYLRAGTYYEQVSIKCRGTRAKPITIRSYPGERAIIDGGLREFYEKPATAWRPYPKGAKDEFRSGRKYPHLGGRPEQTNVLGNFGDSMTPLHGYRYIRDLRSDDMFWRADIRTNKKKGIWCGPGIYYDPKTGYIHARLAHTNLKGLGKDNYQGVTDPRQVPLVIAGFAGGPALTLQDAAYVFLQDLTVRGSRLATVEILNCEDVHLDGMTIYGGSAAIRIKDTWGLMITNTACRGIAAPWTFRSSLKYRSIEARILSASEWRASAKGNRDFIFAFSEFTDSVDGIFIGNVKGVYFHHNLVDNISDDAIFLTSTTAFDGTTPGGPHHIFQNRLSRSLSMFAFGAGHGRQRAIKGGRQTGAGAYIYRNIIDQRGPAMYFPPRGPKVDQQISGRGRFAADHGGPTWEPMWIYHNTIICDQQRGYAYGALGLADHMGNGAKRRVFNNIIVQLKRPVGMYLPPASARFRADGNLLWSMKSGKTIAGNSAHQKRLLKIIADSKKSYPAGWTANDLLADPKFLQFNADWRKPIQLGLRGYSPAVGAGVKLPAWRDSLRNQDRGKPDQGAVPLGVRSWNVGVHGRMSVFGKNTQPRKRKRIQYQARPRPAWKPKPGKPGAIVQGYPAFDAPLLKFAIRKANVPVQVSERAWLEPKDYAKYRLIVLAGSLQRAKVKPAHFQKEHFEHLYQFMEKGGALVVLRSGKGIFATPEGRGFLVELVGKGGSPKDEPLSISDNKHAWVKHLRKTETYPWLESRRHETLPTSKGEVIIGTRKRQASLYRLRVGKGQFIYMGWQITAWQPRRDANTIEQELYFGQQTQIVFNMINDVLSK